MRKLLVALGGLVALGVATLWFLANPFGGAGKPVIIDVVAGQSVATIAQTLEHDGVISSALLFRADCLVEGTPTFRPGYYEIATNSSFSRVRSVFAGLPNADAVAIRPGTTLHFLGIDLASVRGGDFAVQFLADERRAAAVSPWHPNGSLEGLLGLGEYVIGLGETPEHLLTRMTARFTSRMAEIGITPSTTLHGLSAYQLVVAASIVEKEGYYRVNMPKVARVILNRLRRGGGLQMDSTVLYFFNQDGGTVTHAMLATKTDYNTYLHAGLTPTPICDPSVYALRAMMNPPKGTWLYFTLISRDGTMAFSTTFAQQLANERLAASRGI